MELKHKQFLVFNLLLMVGLLFVILFHFNIVLPIEIGVVALAIFSLFGVRFLNLSRLSVLPRLIIVLYSLPFITTLGYLFDKSYIWWEGVPLALQLQLDNLLIRYMLAMGLVGLIGLLTGITLSGLLMRIRNKDLNIEKQVGNKTLNPIMFIGLLGVALFLSSLSAPKTTIFEAAYASLGTHGVAASINFGASFLISYIILILLFIDMEREKKPQLQKRKLMSIFAAAAFIVFFLQLLRGDRESSGLVVGLIALYLTRPHASPIQFDAQTVEWKRIRKLILPVILLLLMFLVLGSARFTFSRAEGIRNFDLGDAIVGNLQRNTWTGVLLTNLGMAGQYRYGMEYYYGQTYIDYIRSLPPGILTRALGIERPLDRKGSPNYWFPGISGGGIHIALVPFKNFGILGMFVILTFYGFVLGNLEIANMSGSFWPRLTYGAVTTSSFLWFWYGDMNIIRGVMAAVILGWIYQSVTKPKIKIRSQSHRLVLQDSVYR
ncbi:MAG: hypothetical protein ACPGWR_00220 [Ardenticatenaceae bacterium]